MSVNSTPRPWVTARLLATLLLSLLIGCAVVRKIGSTEYRMTRDQEARLIAADERASVLVNDPYRTCLHWQAVAGEADPTDADGFARYTADQISSACVPDEQLLVEARAALRTAHDAPDDREAQLRAVSSIDAFVRVQGSAVASPDNLTLRELLTDADPVLARLSLPEVACGDQLRVTGLLWSLGRRDDALTRYLGPQRACLGAEETARVAGKLRDEGRCDDVVVLAAEMWPRATEQHQQIQLLDLVMACSDAYTLRRNFSFVPAEILLDYQALLNRRAADDAQAAWAQQQQRLAERCDEECMTMYSETGVCMSSCRGDSICVQNCRQLGEACWRSCEL